MASQLLLSLYLVATLAVFAAAASAGYPSTSGQLPEQLPSSNLKGLNLDEVVVGPIVGSGSSCDGTKEKLLVARDECCNDLGKRGHCVCSAANQVFDSVEFLHLCNNYDACSASWDDVGTGGDAATGSWTKPAAGGCSLDNLDRTKKQCEEVVKSLKDLALQKKSSGGDCFKKALGKLGVVKFHGLVEKLLSPTGN